MNISDYKILIIGFGILIPIMIIFGYILIHDETIQRDNIINPHLIEMEKQGCDYLENESYIVKLWYYDEKEKFFPVSQKMFDTLEKLVQECTTTDGDLP